MSQNHSKLSSHVNTPLQIGDRTINSRVMLAPMAGVTDVVFRALVRQWAPESLICTEMISSHGLVNTQKYRQKLNRKLEAGTAAFAHPPKALKIIDKTPTDHPIAFQLSSSTIDVLLKAALEIEETKQPDTIDLNMGCPVKKITGNFEGCSLMKSPDRAYELISALTQALKTPVTVKFRLGWDSNSMNYLEFGKMAEAAGAKMVVLHARTRAQGYAPGCKWEAFGELKQALSIPVIANGDIKTLEDVQTVMGTYGVDGVMVGRGAMGQPWLIGDLDFALKNNGELPPAKTLIEKLETAYTHTLALVDYEGERLALKEIRKHLPWYVSGFPGASQYRNQLTQVQSAEAVRTILDEILAQYQHVEKELKPASNRELSLAG